MHDLIIRNAQIVDGTEAQHSQVMLQLTMGKSPSWALGLGEAARKLMRTD